MIEYSTESLSIGKTAFLLGVSVVTLRRWNKLGKLTSFRTFGNHRRFNINDILDIINPSRNKLHVAYARVSSHDQKKDLETQCKRLELIIKQNEHEMLISDLGSGLNYNKNGLKKLINLITSQQVHTLYLTHKDRLLRFGSELIFSLCKKFGTKVVIVDDVQTTTFEQELVQDVIELMTVFSAKLYGKRSHRNKNIITT
jgi:predicted site-specific integrase-resolvase